MFDPLVEYQRILGQTFVERLTDRIHPLIKVGSTKYTIHSFTRKFGVANLAAARRLQNKANELRINVLEFYQLAAG